MNTLEHMDEIQSVLAFVEANPGCGRGMIAAYCNLTPTHTTRLLTTLVRAGKLSRAGDKRVATYTIPR